MQRRFLRNVLVPTATLFAVACASSSSRVAQSSGASSLAGGSSGDLTNGSSGTSGNRRGRFGNSGQRRGRTLWNDDGVRRNDDARCEPEPERCRQRDGDGG